MMCETIVSHTHILTCSQCETTMMTDDGRPVLMYVRLPLSTDKALR